MTSTHPETGSLAQEMAAQAQHDASGAPGQYLPPPQALLDEIGNAVGASELSDPRWLAELRRDAAQRFAAMGFPTPKHEDWHYTSTASIAPRRRPLRSLRAPNISDRRFLKLTSYMPLCAMA